VIGLLLLVIGMMGKRDDGEAAAAARSRAFNAQPTRSPTMAQGAGIGSAETQLSHPSVAAGTPSSLDPLSGPQIVPQNLGPGAMIGRWEVVRRLGSGGMADVYLAQARGDGGFEKLVAIKVMHSHLARTQRAVDHFLDEARLAARIQHPNVVAIQDLGKIGNDYVIVMEYVEGVDLERLLMSARQGERPVPLEIGLGILCRICDGLDAAHNATAPDGSPLGIVHRDVKSANVLVSRQGSVKVVDFGIAKAATQVHHTVAGETKGTPSMMAPEQRVGEQVDVRADVYSVAAVGYELVTGHGVNLDLAALAHLGVDNWPHLPLPSSLRASLPHELDEILLQAMAFERDRRPANCATFEASVQAVMKANNLIASDKDIARWIDSELRHLSPAFGGLPSSMIKSPAV
jgi:serine/threonine-protein kinase